MRFSNALVWHALETCRSLHAAGHEVRLYCQRGAPLADQSKREPYFVNRDLHLNRADPRDVVRGLSALRQALREFRPDVLNPHCPPGHSYLALARLLERQDIPLVRTVADPRPPNRNLINRRLHERHTDALIFTTQSSRQRYERILHLPADRTFTIYPGFRANDFAENVQSADYRKQLSVREDQVLAGIIARMSPEKGQEVLFEALRLLEPDYRRRLRVAIAGADSKERTRRDLEVLATRMGVAEPITFLGKLEQVAPLIAELDFGIITSTRSEAICRIALEYMSFGVPIIVSNVNILPEVVRAGENGWTFANHDAAALARHLRFVIDHADERRLRGKRGYAMVRSEFSAVHEYEEVLTVFERLRDGDRAANVRSSPEVS